MSQQKIKRLTEKRNNSLLCSIKPISFTCSINDKGAITGINSTRFIYSTGVVTTIELHLFKIISLNSLHTTNKKMACKSNRQKFPQQRFELTANGKQFLLTCRFHNKKLIMYELIKDLENIYNKHNVIHQVSIRNAILPLLNFTVTKPRLS